MNGDDGKPPKVIGIGEAMRVIEGDAERAARHALFRKIRASWNDEVEAAKLQADWARLKYDAYIEKKFTPKEAMQLVIADMYKVAS